MEQFNINTNEDANFDFRSFIYKMVSYWKLFLICILIGFSIAYLINVRKQNIYRLDSLISIENDQNPFFTANTSISFNWGGVSSKVGKIITAIKTRTHNEKVVDSLVYYLQYLKEGKYRKVDIYKKTPFYVQLDKTKNQVLNIPIVIRFIDDKTFEMTAEFENNTILTQNYSTKSKQPINLSKTRFKAVFNVNEPIELPFFNGTINKYFESNIENDAIYYIKFLNYDSVVNSYKNDIKIEPYSKSSPSILKLELSGHNKVKIVDYLNATTSILSKTQLNRKNLYATNTIKFIDSTMAIVDANLKDVVDEMNNFRKKNNVINIDEEMLQLSSRLRDFELKKEEQQSKLNYLSNLENYLNTKTDYSNIAAPTSVGVNEENILGSVAKITALSVERQNLEYTTREGSALFKDLDRQIDSEKKVLLETINSTKSIISTQLNIVNRNITQFESKLGNLPEDQQQYLKIQRKLDISQETYDVYMTKRSEAAIVKAANVSDITTIDEAKDIGQGPIGPNKDLNYLVALMLGFFIPLVSLFLIFFFDNNIHTTEDIEKLSSIPFLGVIGHNKLKTNLAVFEKPQSSIAEAFRAIRSSLQFIYKKQQLDGSKKLLITSSISGEGKTFCSINIASVFALTQKKTVLVGLDLRKPKIFDDFYLKNEKGVVNYLIGELGLKGIVQKTHIDNLDIITSGAIPPNPSELLLNERMAVLMEELNKQYDIIILDSPPLGLVSDAMEIVNYADAIVYVIRQNYTKKGMLKAINDKYQKGEIKNVSFIFNDYKHKIGHNYGYGYGYGGYDNKYLQETEKISFFKTILKRFRSDT